MVKLGNRLISVGIVFGVHGTAPEKDPKLVRSPVLAEQRTPVHPLNVPLLKQEKLAPDTQILKFFNSQPSGYAELTSRAVLWVAFRVAFVKHARHR